MRSPADALTGSLLLETTRSQRYPDTSEGHPRSISSIEGALRCGRGRASARGHRGGGGAVGDGERQLTVGDVDRRGLPAVQLAAEQHRREPVAHLALDG